MCGYFCKKNRSWLLCGPNGAAAAFGRPITRATLVSDKKRQLERLEAVLAREAAGRAEMASREAAGSEDDVQTKEYRIRVLAAAIAKEVWLPRSHSLSAEKTYEALGMLGWHDGLAGRFSRSAVEEAMDAANGSYNRIVNTCRYEIRISSLEHELNTEPECKLCTV